MENTPSSDTFSCAVSRGQAGLLSMCSTCCLAALPFLSAFAILSKYIMHQSSDSDLMPLLENEDTVITSGRDKQYSNRGHGLRSLTSFSLGRGVYFWHNNGGGRGRDRGPVLLTQESHITEATGHAAETEGGHTTGPQASSPSEPSLVRGCVLFFFF